MLWSAVQEFARHPDRQMGWHRPYRSDAIVKRAGLYHATVRDFRRRLIETTLEEHAGNRTHTARALGIQRTYLLRLIRDLDVRTTPAPRRQSGGPRVW